MKYLTTTLIFIFLMLFAFSCGCKAQNIKQSQVKYLPDSLRNKYTKIEADTKFQDKTAFDDSFQVNFNRTSIDQIKEISTYEPIIQDSSILMYLRGEWRIFDFGEYSEESGGSLNDVDSLGGIPASDYVTKTLPETVTGEKTFTSDSTTIHNKLLITREPDNLLINGTFNSNITSWVGGGYQTFEWVANYGGLTGCLHFIGNSNSDYVRQVNLEVLGVGVTTVTATFDIVIGVNTADSITVGILHDGGVLRQKILSSGYNEFSFANADLSGELTGIYFTQYGAGSTEFWIDNVTLVVGETQQIEVTPDSISLNSGTLSWRGVPFDFFTTKSYTDGLDSWTSGLSDNSQLLALGLPNRQFYFNNGQYSDFWMGGFVTPPYNLPFDYNSSFEYRTDYFNDTLKVYRNNFYLMNIGGTGTPIWHPTYKPSFDGLNINMNFSDLPDSIGLNWLWNNVALSHVQMGDEVGKTAVATRFPMPVYGYRFRFVGTPSTYYTYPYMYGFYSDFSTYGGSAKIEQGYHFYGKGDFPSYFGGNVLTDGYIQVQDSIIIGSATVKIYPDSITVGGTRLAKITETSGVLPDSIVYTSEIQGDTLLGTAETLDSITIAFWNGTLANDTTGLWDLIYGTVNDMPSDTLLGTAATLDSIITAFWNGTLSGGITSIGDADDVDLTGLDDFEILQYRDEFGTFVPIPIPVFDTTFVYQRIANLESDVDSLMNLVNAILTALDTCGCGDIVVEDNTPPLKPTSYEAIGGTSQTQYVSTWTDPADADLDSVRFYEGSANDSTSLVWITSINEGVQTYTRTGRTANTTYWSAVKAIDDSGNVSYFSNIDSAKTLASAVVDTGFFKFDAEDGVANLTITGAGVSASTDQKYAGSYSYKVSGLGGATRTFADIDFTDAGAGDEDTIWVTYRIYIPAGTSISSNDGWNYASLLLSGGDANGDNGEMGLQSSTDSIYAWQKPFGTERTTNWQTGAWHKVEIKYIQGTGANATDSCWIDGTAIYGTSTGAGAVDTDGFRFGAYNYTMNIGEAIYYDDIIFSRQRVVE